MSKTKADILKEYQALQSEMLTPEVFIRVSRWLQESPPRSASAAFTAGIERQIAYLLEMHVLPEYHRVLEENKELKEKNETAN